jgi:hypothetical protein
MAMMEAIKEAIPGTGGSQAEGSLARAIESRTAQLPSDLFLWVAMGSIATSLTARMLGNRDLSQFIGQWAPTILILGLYNKLVKVAGHERVTA